MSISRTQYVWSLAIVAVIAYALLLVPQFAHAANLNWSSDTTLTFTGLSGNTTLTVKSGSTATTLTVDTTTATVTLGSGESFIVEDASTNQINSSYSTTMTNCNTTTQLVMERAGIFTFNPSNNVRNCGGSGFTQSSVVSPPVKTNENPEGQFKAVINSGASTTSSQQVSLALFGAADTANVAISEDRSFANATLQAFVGIKQFTLSSADGVKTIYVRFYNQLGKYQSEEVLDSIVLVKMPSEPKQVGATEKPTTEKKEGAIVVKPELTRLFLGLTLDAAAEQVGKERNVKMEATVEKSFGGKIEGLKVSAAAKGVLVAFATYGTEETKQLSSNDRAQVVKTYTATFKSVPDTEKELADVVRIASGQAPLKQNAAAERKAAIEFKKLYKRSPDAKNAADQNAIDWITYGIRPVVRDVKAEQSAIAKFKARNNKKSPKSDADWSIVRAAAYSGVKK